MSVGRFRIAGLATMVACTSIALVSATSRTCGAEPDATAQDAAPAARAQPSAAAQDVATWGQVEVVSPALPVVEGKNLRIDAEHIASIANARIGAVRTQYRDPAVLGELVRDVAHDRLLADEARRRGLAKRPSVAHQIDDLLARELLRDRLVAVERATVDEPTLRAWYAANIALFTRPPQVRARLLGVTDVAEARRLRARAASMTVERFTALLRREAQGRSRRRGGDTGWFDADAGSVDAAVVRACFAGSGTGLLPGVVKGDDDGTWYVVWVTEREGAEVRPFERVVRSVESHWRAEQRRRATDSLVSDIAARRSVTIHPVQGRLRYAGGPAPDAGVTPPASTTGTPDAGAP